MLSSGWRHGSRGTLRQVIPISIFTCQLTTLAFYLYGLLGSAPAVSKVAQIGINRAHLKLPLYFEPNQGQADPAVHFLSRGSGFVALLKSNEVVLVTEPPVNKSARTVRSSSTLGVSPQSRASEHPVFRIQLLHANPAVRVLGMEKLPTKSNYFIGDDPVRWRTNIPTYARVEYEGVYPGIDVVFYGTLGQLEYDFVITPGGDPKAIRLAFPGSRDLSIDREGNLVLEGPHGRVVQHVPAIYQYLKGAMRKVRGRYLLQDGQVAVKVGEYDTALPLIIDPVLSYSTYIGASGSDGAVGAVDSDGSIYLTGTTDSVDFPKVNPVQAALAGGSDVFVAKLNTTGSSLIYVTYIGGRGQDESFGIAVDLQGSTYIAGRTGSLDFPVVGAIQPTNRGAQSAFVPYDAFVAKLNSTGSALIYSTYLGGSEKDEAFGIAVDPAGNAYVTGHTLSRDFPTVSAFQSSFGGESRGFGGPFGDAFVAKLNTSGSALVYCSYLGGSEGDQGFGIAIDAIGNAYVTGATSSENFPTLRPFQANRRGSGDAFVTKINGAGVLVYSTYLGGSDSELGSERGFGIAVDSEGNVYVTGDTSSADFPTASPLQAGRKGRRDAFVTKLNVAGSSLLYSTYLGGTGDNEVGNSIALDGAGNVYVAGWTDSTDFPTVNPLQPTNAGGRDAFIAKLNNRGSALIYSSYLGGTHDESAMVAVDPSGTAYLIGTTSSTDFPTVNALQRVFGGGFSDAFVARISDAKKLYFAQFGDGSQGSTSIVSQITLINLDSGAPTSASVEINDDSGNPLKVNLNGMSVPGRKDFVIPVDGAVTFKTDGQGPIQTGSVVVTSDRNISGVILLGGSVGTAGVGDSKPLRKFVALTETGSGVNTGIAIMGLGQQQTIQLELRDQQGKILARANLPLGAKSHIARFVTELPWNTPPNFSSFGGTLKATGTADLAATVIRVSPGEFATLPVTEIN